MTEISKTDKRAKMFMGTNALNFFYLFCLRMSNVFSFFFILKNDENIMPNSQCPGVYSSEINDFIAKFLSPM